MAPFVTFNLFITFTHSLSLWRGEYAEYEYLWWIWMCLWLSRFKCSSPASNPYLYRYCSTLIVWVCSAFFCQLVLRYDPQRRTELGKTLLDLCENQRAAQYSCSALWVCKFGHNISRVGWTRDRPPYNILGIVSTWQHYFNYLVYIHTFI